MRLVSALSLAATVLAVVTVTRADPDLWGHVRFGRDMVYAGQIRLPDRYSFAADRPWVNHEWLAEVVMYSAYRVAGGAGLVALKALLILAVLGAVAVALRDVELPPIARHGCIGLALVATVPQAVHVRPQVFSLALFAWLLVVLLRARSKPAAAFAIVPMFVAWANLHGGWIVGAAVLALWAAIERRAAIALAAAGAIAATAVNPYGVGLWSFLRDTVGLARPDITDWQPVMTLGGMYAALWVLTLAVLLLAAATALRTRGVERRTLVVAAALALLSFRVNRVESFFAIAVAILGGRCFAGVAGRAPRPAIARSSLRTAAAAAVSAALCVAALGATAANATCVRMDAAALPDPELATMVASAGLRGRMLAWFDWGEYAIWQWGDRGITVSIDGRRETVYSDAVLRDHLRFYFDPSSRAEVLARLQPDYVWLPTGADAAGWLVERQWTPLYAGRRAVLLARPGLDARAALPAGSESAAPRCFPGP